MRALRPTRARVDLDALARNHRRLAGGLPSGTVVMPVVKADAYGHGAGPVACRLERDGARSLAVAVVEEGAELRRAGVAAEILVMGFIGKDQLPDLVRHRLVPNAHSLELLADLAAFATGHAIDLDLHLKLDTGMTRLGLRPADLPDALERLGRAPRLHVRGLFQNFASADDPSSTQTAAQLRVFSDAWRTLAAACVGPVEIHVGNSAGSLRALDWPDDLPGPSRVRPGLALYTRFPGLRDDLEDVMTFASVVDQVKRVPAGTRVGYGGTWVAPEERTVAIVPAGYADGVPRSLSGTGQVLVLGRRCPIAGRVSMDLTAVDVSALEVPPVRGDEVVFFGRQGGTRLGVEEAAAHAGTVSWELLCGVGPRVPRQIVEEGRETRVLSRFVPSGDEERD